GWWLVLRRCRTTLRARWRPCLRTVTNVGAPIANSTAVVQKPRRVKVNNSNKLGWQLAAIATVVTLCGTSAFAEDRHRNGTRGGEARVARESDGNGRINRAPAPQQQVQPQAAAATRDAGTWRNADQNRSSDRGTQSRDTWQSRDRAQAESRNDAYNRGTRNDSSNRGTRNDSYNRGDRNDSSNRGTRNDSYNRGSRNDSYNRGSRDDA